MLLVVALSVFGNPALADSSAGGLAIEIRNVTIGFDGHFKVGYWTPVAVTVENKGERLTADVQLQALDGDAVTTRYSTAIPHEVEVAANQRTTIVAYAKFGRTTGGLRLRVQAGSDRLAETTVAFDDNFRPAPSTSELIVSIGNDIGVSDALNLRQGGDSTAAETNHVVLNPAEHVLPDHWMGYESVDTLVLTTDEVAKSGSLLARGQLEAIATWVKLGGRLLLSVGPDGSQLLEQSGPIAELLPGRFERHARATNAAGLESYVRATRPLDSQDGVIWVTVLTDVRGRVESSERVGGKSQPTIIRSLYGFGHVVFVAMDLDDPVFRRWPDRPRLVANLLSRLSGRPQQTGSEVRSGRASHLGYTDMTGQLRAALDQFEGVRPLAFSAIVAMIVVYILLIGPGDYFFLRKFGRRMEWTWLTFALLVAGFCGVVIVLVGLTRSEEVHVNSVEVIDVDAVTGVARGTAWFHVYSPSTESYDLTFRPRLPMVGDLDGVLLSWNGLPGRGLNGMDTSAPVVTTGDGYDTGQRPANGELRMGLAGVPIHTSSSKSVLARWWASLEDVPPGQLYKDARDGSLRGEFSNPLDVELTDCVVLFGNWAYRLDRRLGAGEIVVVDESLTEKTIEAFLNERRVIESQDVATPWNTSGQDIARIMEVMLFFEAAGGQEYTDLSLAYQNFVDLSDHVEAGRAILFARARRPFGRLENDGQPMDDAADDRRPWTFVRIVLPVAGADGSKR